MSRLIRLSFCYKNLIIVAIRQYIKRKHCLTKYFLWCKYFLSRWRKISRNRKLLSQIILCRLQHKQKNIISTFPSCLHGNIKQFIISIFFYLKCIESDCTDAYLQCYPLFDPHIISIIHNVYIYRIMSNS